MNAPAITLTGSDGGFSGRALESRFSDHGRRASSARASGARSPLGVDTERSGPVLWLGTQVSAYPVLRAHPPDPFLPLLSPKTGVRGGVFDGNGDVETLRVQPAVPPSGDRCHGGGDRSPLSHSHRVVGECGAIRRPPTTNQGPIEPEPSRLPGRTRGAAPP